MWVYDATEQAFRNGYEAGKKDAVVRGHWIKYNNALFANTLVCSECSYNHITSRTNPNYCPNCGAKMDGDGNA